MCFSLWLNEPETLQQPDGVCALLKASRVFFGPDRGGNRCCVLVCVWSRLTLKHDLETKAFMRVLESSRGRRFGGLWESWRENDDRSGPSPPTSLVIHF